MFMNYRNRVDNAWARYRITWETTPQTPVRPYWLDVKNCLIEVRRRQPRQRRETRSSRSRNAPVPTGVDTASWRASHLTASLFALVRVSAGEYSNHRSGRSRDGETPSPHLAGKGLSPVAA